MKVIIILVVTILLSLPAPFIDKIQIRSVAAQSRGSINRPDISYRMVKVRRTGIRFPRITYYRDKGVMQLVNRQIDELTKEFGCEDGVDRKRTSYEVRSRVEYAAKDVFSIYASASFYCGGQYPINDANMSITFDLQTGKKIEFVNLFKNYEQDKENILKAVFAKHVATAEKLAASGKESDTTCEGDPYFFSIEHLTESRYSYIFQKQESQYSQTGLMS